MGTKYDTRPLAKGTIDRYLIQRRKFTRQHPLPNPLPDNVYQALLYHGENPWSNEDIAKKFNLAQEEERLASNLWEGAKKFRDKRIRGPLY